MKSELLTQGKIDELLESKNWMIRFDSDGKSYLGFEWKPVGKWTRPLVWNPAPVCGNGLHGQSPRAAGSCQTGTRLVFCETKKQIIIAANKVKTPLARILATDSDIPIQFLVALTSVGGYLSLGGYDHPLPEGLTSVGGYLSLGGYDHPLPKGLRRKTR